MSWLPSVELPSPNDAERSRARAIRCLPDEIAPHVLLPGDPFRARMIAEKHLENGRLVMVNREFHTYRGSYRGCDVSVISTGLGAPGATMVVQDLALLGVRSAIRVGTAGAGAEPVAPGDIVIATGAVRDEGASRHFLELAFPAVPDAGLTDALYSSTRTLNRTQVHRGVVHTSDAFQSPVTKALLPDLINAGVLAFEMEAAAIFIKAATLGLPVACILAVDGYVRNVHSGNVIPDFKARDQAIDQMINCALEAVLTYDSTLNALPAPERKQINDNV